jgi:DNA-binding PucR family transcriptional regulator
VLHVADLAAETALALQPRLAALLRDTLLPALRPADEFHRELASTALAYLDHGQRLDRTAQALHVHPNTVRYRLRRLQEITGLPPVPDRHLTVLETLRYWWALRTWLDARRPA